MTPYRANAARRRRWWPRLGKISAMANTRAAAASARTVHTVKITLLGAKPPIWRRLQVPSRIDLLRLHYVVQDAFGWENCHMWVFETTTGSYGMPDRELGHRNAAGVRLDQIAARPGARLRYTYDFGDDWEHDLLVEDVTTAEPGIAYPRCLSGRRACPPEDCGGMWGYTDLLEILADPTHEEHHERLEWLGLDTAADFDPAHFDPTETNEALADHAKVLIKA